MMEEETVLHMEEPTAEEKTGTGSDKCCFAKKYREAKESCRSLVARIRKDLRETDGNPYIRATTTRRYDLYRSPQDQEPIDSFVLKRSGGYALRTMILTAGILTVAYIALGHRRKK